MGIEDKFGTEKKTGLEAAVDEYHNPNPDKYDKKWQLDKKSSAIDVTKDITKYSPFAAAQIALVPAIAASTLITSIGFMIAGYFKARKEKKVYTWKRAWQDFKKGNRFGYLDYGIFAAANNFKNYIPYLGGTGVMNKIAKTAFFEATVVPPAVAGYNTLGYIQNDMGYGKFMKNLATLKWKETFSEIYQNAIKGQVWKGTKSIWKIAPLLHHAQLNYLEKLPVPSPIKTEHLQMAQAAFVNNPVFSYILERKAKTPEYKSDKYKKAA